MDEPESEDEDPEVEDPGRGLPRPTLIPVPCMECRRIMWLRPGRQYVRCFDCAPQDY